MPVTKCPLCARPYRAGEAVRPGVGDIIPQGSKDSRRVPSSARKLGTLGPNSAEGGLEREDWGVAAGGGGQKGAGLQDGFLARVALGTFLRDVLRQLGRNCLVLGTKEVPQEDRE